MEESSRMPPSDSKQLEGGDDDKMKDRKRSHTDQNDSSNQRREKKSRKSNIKKVDVSKQPAIVLTLLRVDPILQFLTKATGNPLVPMNMVKAALPGASSEMLINIEELVEREILQVVGSAGSDLAWDSDNIVIGFPSPPSMEENSQCRSVNTNGTLHGSTKTAAKRRLAALKRSLKQKPGASNVRNCAVLSHSVSKEVPPAKNWTVSLDEEEALEEEDEVFLEEEKKAREALGKMFHFTKKKKRNAEKGALFDRRINCILPKQAAYSGSNPKRECAYSTLSQNINIPSILLDAFGIVRDGPSPVISARRKLFSHQAAAIESAMQDIHTLVCTGTGSGKSLCFLLPVLAAAMRDETSLLLFPTKALAQDQFTKLFSVIKGYPELEEKIKPGIIDGDVPHEQRCENAKKCNIILTNPDTLHAAMLPAWKSVYKGLLGRIKYVVIDEAHMYEGVFGAHVSMVLSRFIRLSAVCSYKMEQAVRLPIFLACSATMSHPEQHFRLLCPISTNAKIAILYSHDDGSPRSAKHFFVWNPPIMSTQGGSTGRVTMPRQERKVEKAGKSTENLFVGFSQTQGFIDGKKLRESDSLQLDQVDMIPEPGAKITQKNGVKLYRRHAADETALLLARALSQGNRCIAFCKTRCLVEWVYERAISALKADESTEHLANRLEVYRGGYTKDVRRSIEKRLFKGDLLGVVGTSALELGVDVGGIDLTLHCGYPTSYASLLQQAGRAGRGTERLDTPSLAIMICFCSPSEQHIWRNPTSLLSRGQSAPVSMPVNTGLVQGHLLCAGEEYPLTAQHPVSILFSIETSETNGVLNDYDLFGSTSIFQESLSGLLSSGLMKEEKEAVAASKNHLPIYKTHPFIDRPWTRVNLRSIEPINYAIVDLSHPLQGGLMDGIHDEQVVLDNIPYSRVFYHAFPGAIITHRGRRFKVQSMTRPPIFAESSIGYKGGTLAAYAKPTTARYHTRPLSTMRITVVKQIDRVDDFNTEPRKEKEITVDSTAIYSEMEGFAEKHILSGSLAGNGVVNVRRSVHGYKKISAITRVELSRTELSLPAMEFDTFGFWIDTEAPVLSSVIKDYNEGVHALSHAILSVAPLFVPCGSSDLQCDHNVYDCTKIVIFDVRAGGSGNCANLFKFIFIPDGLLHCAVNMLQNCNQCKSDLGYDGGCPSCLHFGECLKFNQDLSKTAAIHIGKRLIARIEKTAQFQENLQEKKCKECNTSASTSSSKLSAREKALRQAKEISPTKGRNVILGRSYWSADSEHGAAGKQVQAD